MRFSLLSLLLPCCTIGAGVGVYVLNGAWKETLNGPDARNKWETAYYTFKRLNVYSSDKSRFLYESHILESANMRVLFELPAERACFSTFLDDNTIISIHSDKATGSVWRRRYPEWWWGHFYRPELWLLLVFGSLWMWRIVCAFRKRGKV